MKISIRAGHNTKAVGCSGIIDEVTEAKKVLAPTIAYLKELGHTVLDVTPSAMDSTNDLIYGVNKANNWGADLFVSIHFNKAYSTYKGAIGSECLVYDKSDAYKDEVFAQRIVDKLSSLGFKNRGVKERTDLYELKNTKMAAVIIEVCFVEATEDVALYKKVGADKVGKVIAEAIANKTVPTTPTTSTTTYRVVTGSFKDRANADSRIADLKKAGFDSFLEIIK